MNSDEKKVMIAMFIVLLVLSGALYYQLSYMKEKEGMTAMEAKTEADKIAFEWNSSATLMSCVLCGDLTSDGKAYCWIFTYQDRIDGNATYMFDVKIYYDGRHETDVLRLNGPSSTHGIENWTVDSDEAYSIAMNNEEIKSFMKRYDDAHVVRLSLFVYEKNGTPIWDIYILDSGVWENPHAADIKIDGTTGEVLYVRSAPGSSFSVKDICVVCTIFLLFPIVAISVALLAHRKKRREEEERIKIWMEKRNMQNEIGNWDERHGKK